MNESQERSYIGPRNVGSLQGFQARSFSDLKALEKIGIGISENKARVMAEFAMDAMQAPITTPSIPSPVQFLQNWLPGFVGQMTSARKIDEIVGISTVGNWTDEEVVQGMLENIGIATPYRDYTNIPLSSWNAQFERRTNVVFESGLRVGPMEEERAARTRINSAQSKRKSSAMALEIQRNLVGFNGYNSGNDRTYGLLNDPNLPAYVNVATGAASSLNWSKKTFQEIKADLLEAFQALRTQSKDTIDPAKTPITLVVATSAVDYLANETDFGRSPKAWLNQNYPNVRVVSAPQLNTANGGAGVFYAFAEIVEDETSTDDSRTFVQIVPAKFQVIGVSKQAKGYEEDYACATAGVMCKRPYAVVRRSGIC